jgi:hypothetical protein
MDVDRIAAEGGASARIRGVARRRSTGFQCCRHCRSTTGEESGFRSALKNPNRVIAVEQEQPLSPSNAEQWMRVATERGADADALAGTRERSIGAIYLAGFAIECSLKAFLRMNGIPFPSSGRAGHNLKALWASCAFRLADLGDSTGHRTFFVTDWSTDLRYSDEQIDAATNTERVRAAKALAGWIQTRARRRKSSA